MTQTGKRALIFGAGGFVGAYLAKELAENGYEVFGSDLRGTTGNPDFSGYRSGDLTDADAVRSIVDEFQPSAIVNLAAISSVGQSWKMPQVTMSVNVNGTLNILDAAKALKSPPKILLIGSSEEYAPSGAPLKETDPIDANNPYGISKTAQERFAEIYEKHYGLRIYRTRSFNHTGISQPSSFVLPSWCSQVAEIEKSGRPGILKVGNIDVARDFSDVRDVVYAYRTLLESDSYGQVYNIGSGIATPLREIIETVIGFSSREISYEVDQALIRPSDQPCVQADISKATRELGWQPEIPLMRTLRDMYESFLRE